MALNELNAILDKFSKIDNYIMKEYYETNYLLNLVLELINIRRFCMKYIFLYEPSKRKKSKGDKSGDLEGQVYSKFCDINVYENLPLRHSKKWCAV